MDGATIMAFAGIMLLAAVSPGPDFAVVVRRAAVSGRGPGTLTALGIAAGIFVWAITAATGIAALVAASALAFLVLKLAGAAYLLALGVRALVAARRAGHEPPTAPTGGHVTAWTSFRQGLLCNLFNPKAAVFFGALLPQFLSGHAGIADTLVLALVAVAVTGAWFIAVANLVGTFRRLLAHGAARRAIDAVTGTALVALGLRLAATARTAV